MQLTELSETGVRSAVVRLSHPTKQQVIVLFPMLHFADPKFYRKVARRLRKLDVVVAEGFDRPSSTGYAILLAGRLTRQRGVRRLTFQDIDYEALGIPVIWPDRLWGNSRRRDSWTFREWVGIVCLLPVLVLAMVVGGSTVLLTSNKEFSSETPQLSGLVSAYRDQRLLAALDRVVDGLDRALDQWEGRPVTVTVGVVYGAAHMPAVIRHLTDRRGFYPDGSKWLDVMVF
ncbi:hypothetical protein [Pseudonocardia sp. TRM90224]|uniref:hypothetical protein n=1 Tax=Pseudonocardia sp. TRM90224 TaxID=2812678 RepID=UPI001E29B0E6|nr:hypothetical protein [Pseudonocardia sp. TRM90224]